MLFRSFQPIVARIYYPLHSTSESMVSAFYRNGYFQEISNKAKHFVPIPTATLNCSGNDRLFEMPECHCFPDSSNRNVVAAYHTHETYQCSCQLNVCNQETADGNNLSKADCIGDKYCHRQWRKRNGNSGRRKKLQIEIVSASIVLLTVVE